MNQEQQQQQQQQRGGEERAEDLSEQAPHLAPVQFGGEDVEVDALGSDDEERALVRGLQSDQAAQRANPRYHVQRQQEALDAETEDEEDDDGGTAEQQRHQVLALAHGGPMSAPSLVARHRSRSSSTLCGGGKTGVAMTAATMSITSTDGSKYGPSEALREALRALRHEETMSVVELLTRLRAVKGELATYLFRFPVPHREGLSLKEPVRIRAMQWLLVLDYATQLQQEHAQQQQPQQQQEGGEEGEGGKEEEVVPRDPAVLIRRLGDMAPHKICQFAFKRNDIVWICKDCQKDETCVLCNECFRNSQHEGHEVYFYHTQAGGCCDCGDEDAWDKQGFCHRHGQDGDDPLSHLPLSFIAACRWVTACSVGFLKQAAEALQESFDLEHVEDAVWAGEAASAGPGEEAEYYLTLHNDDVHSKREVADLLQGHLGLNNQMARVLADLVHEQGEARLHFGSLEDVRPKAQTLRGQSLLVSLVTRRLYKVGKVGLMQVQWLYRLAGVSGGTCRLVVEQLSPPVLSRLMVAHGHLPKPLGNALHALYLFLMADQKFKSAVAQAYADTYLAVSSFYGAGVGVAESGLYTLSVQFLNRPAFVNELVGQRKFLDILVQALGDMIQRAVLPTPSSLPPSSLSEAAPPPSISPYSFLSFREQQIYGSLHVSHPVLRYRRYSPVVADLKFVLNVPGVSAHFAKACMDAWIARLLLPLQYVHSQKRELREHVAYESREWMFAFNVQISLSHVLDCLLNWVRTAEAGQHLSLQQQQQQKEEEKGGKEGGKEEANATVLPGIGKEGVNEGGLETLRESRAPASMLAVGMKMLQAIEQWQEALFAPMEQVHSEKGRGEVEGMKEGEEEGTEDVGAILNDTGTYHASPPSPPNPPPSPPTTTTTTGAGSGSSSSSSSSAFFPLYPQGTLQALRLPERRSFHIILHRALAFLVRESVKNPALSITTTEGGDEREGELEQLLAYIGNNPHLALGLFEVPLSVLVFSAEIRCGLWRRNGQVMMDQVINYMEPPFCRVFRDLDLLLLQVVAAASSFPPPPPPPPPPPRGRSGKR